jgi:2-polyprenyl-6-methoxyphenol hydroxylase-like FAD-dependent oxidoreductase
MRVAVVGCGTGGPAAALLLHAAGHEVTVFERVPAPEPVGAGLLLQPTGLAVLRRLGLLDEVVEGGAHVARLHGVTTRGKAVLDLAYADLAPGLYGLGVLRGVLFDALFGAVKNRAIELRLGIEIDHADDGILRDTAGGRHGPYELVVAADGARSQLRPAHLVKRAKGYRWGALWSIAADPADDFGGVLAQVYRGTRKMVGFLPSGRGQVSMFWSIPADEVDAWRANGLDAWKDDVRDLAPHAEPLLAQITSIDEVVHAAYHDVILRAPYAGNLVMLGDAGHAMSPQLGQGANLALADAAVLADTLAQGKDLAAFAKARKAHVRYYAWASRLLTPLFQSRIDVLGPPRDVLLGPAQRIPPIRRQFLASLAGAKAGPLQAPVPPPP